jgi:hypothetical protein
LNPHSSPHPLAAIGMLIETRRVPASSRPAIRDMAKTYVLQRLLTRPWRRAKTGVTDAGGRADLEELKANRQHLNSTGKRVFSQGREAELWINKPFILNRLSGGSGSGRGMKADLPLSRNRSLQHLPQRGKNGVEFCVIAALHLGDFSPQVFVSCEHGPELDERAHDSDVDLHGPLAAKNTGKHRHALFG